jgi:hypothetical protein
MDIAADLLCKRRSAARNQSEVADSNIQFPHLYDRDSTYFDGSLELEEDGLRDENLASLGAQIPDLGLKQLDLLAGAATTDLQEPVNYRVKINFVLVCHLCEVLGSRRGGGQRMWWMLESARRGRCARRTRGELRLDGVYQGVDTLLQAINHERWLAVRCSSR